ncbi:MAG: hypothetical protein CMO35_07720 [Verrucomicrobiaceae bacterium]|nr:hypothetical protein [Verrucomicrobiaceae bacterium]
MHHFKAATLALLALMILAAGVGLYLLNSHGFAGRWSERIGRELAQRGIHAEFESVRFSPTRGVIASKVRFFTDESRKEVYARIPVLRFDVDRGKAFRGKLQIRRAYLQDAQLTIPVSDDLSLQISDLTGRASVDRHNRLRLEADRGNLGGMNFQLNIALDDFKIENLRRGPESRTGTERWSNFTSDLLKELNQWSFHDGAPPLLKLEVKGSLNRPTSIRTAISLTAPELMRNGYIMKDVGLSGELGNRSLTIDTLSFSDDTGNLSLQAHYDLEDKTGGYDGSSSIQISDLLRNFFQDDSLSEIISPRPPEINARGKFSIHEDGLQLSAVGSLFCEHFSFLGIPFENINSEFSWQNGDIYLRNLTVKHQQGELTGEVKVQDDLIQYRAKTSLPFSAYRPFVREKSGLERFLTESEFTEKSRILVDARGTVWRSNLRDWDATGTFQVEDFRYNGIPITLATADFYMSPLDYIFDNVETIFDYREHERSKELNGPDSGVVTVRQIHFDAKTGLTRLSDLAGKVWPAPIMQLFIPKTAQQFAKTYRFRKPPHLEANGIIDHRKPGNRSEVLTSIKADGLMDYTFLGKSLEIAELSGAVRSSFHQNEIIDLKIKTLGGTVTGGLTHRSDPNRVTLRLQAQGLDLSRISNTYQFPREVPGFLTASIAAEATEKQSAESERRWDMQGACNLGKSSCNGVSISEGSTRFVVNPQGIYFTDGKLEFDYSDYVLKNRYGGPDRSTLRVEQIHHERSKRITEIVNLQGTAWPGPLISLADPRSGELIDQMFGFRQPPTLSASGRFDHKKPTTETLLDLRLTSPGVMDYEFLGKDLQLTAVSAAIRSTSNRHEVSDLSFRTFGGTGAGTIAVTRTPDQETLIDAGIRWDNMNLSEIGRKFAFEKDAQGAITGRLDFNTIANRKNTLNGKGVIGLRNGQLFNVPIFGPLSLPLGTVLGKQYSHEQARDASATFVLENGVVLTKDLLTSTTSTTFVGEGSIDLNNQQMDLTMRMNARGLLGLVTLPLTPLKGLFQFRGQGPLKKPIWNVAPFTEPAGGRSHAIFKNPPRAEIVPER